MFDAFWEGRENILMGTPGYFILHYVSIISLITSKYIANFDVFLTLMHHLRV